MEEQNLPEELEKTQNSQLKLEIENGQLCFFAGNFAGTKLLHDIETAKKSIKIASPFISEKEIELLREKSFGNVVDDIMVITSYDDTGKRLNQKLAIKKLIHREKHDDPKDDVYTANFSSVFFRGSFFHAKLYLIDDKIAYAGSFNFTDKGMKKNFETSIRIKDQDMVSALSRFFDKLLIANKAKWDVSELGKLVHTYEEVIK